MIQTDHNLNPHFENKGIKTRNINLSKRDKRCSFEKIVSLIVKIGI